MRDWSACEPNYTVCCRMKAASRASVVAGAVEDFVATVLDNSVAPLVQHLARNETISERELEVLKDLLKKAEERQK